MGFANKIKSFFSSDSTTSEPVKTATVAADEQMPLNALIDFLGLKGTPANKLSEATYFACMKILCENMGKLPLKVVRNTKETGVSVEYGHDLYQMLRLRPNPYVPASFFWGSIEFERNHYGNAYALIRGAGKNTSLWQLPASQVQVKRKGSIGGGNVVIYYIYTDIKTGKAYKLHSEEVLHFRTSISTDGITGLSVMDILSTTLDGNLKAQGMLNKLYDNGFTSKATVEYIGQLNNQSTHEVLKQMEDYATGKEIDVQNLLPIPAGWKLTPLNIKLTDAQFIELKKYSALQIAAAFGIKPNQINDYEKSSYSNSTAQQLAFLVETLAYILRTYEDELTYKLLATREVVDGYELKFNEKAILRTDSKTQIETLKMGVQSFMISPNEARAELGRGSKEGGDELIGNGNMIPISMVGKQYIKGDPKDDETSD